PEAKSGDVVAPDPADDRRRVVALVAEDGGRADFQHAGRLLGDGHEDALRACLRRDQRRDPPQRPLLLRKPADLRELRPEVTLERSFVGDACREVDPARDEVRRLAVVVEHRLVRPGDQVAATVLRGPVADLRAREARLPDVDEDFPERIGLLARNDEVARVAADDLVAAEPGRALAGVVEEDDSPGPVEHADERLRRLGEDLGELVAEPELLSRARHGTRLPREVRLAVPSLAGSSHYRPRSSPGNIASIRPASSEPPVWDEKETFELVAVRTEARRVDFDDWVLRRLSDWPSARIHQFETF